MRILASIALSLSLMLGGCAEWQKAQQVFTVATTATVPASVVRPAANAFDILKGTAANFAKFCVDNQFTPPGCDVDTRRAIVKWIDQGTSARVQLRASLKTNQPALATVYNLLIGAVNGLQATPVNTFSGGK